MNELHPTTKSFVLFFQKYFYLLLFASIKCQYPSIRAAFTFPFINTVPGFVVAACMMFWGEKLPMTPAIAGGLGVCALGMQAIVIMIIAKAEDFPGSKTILNILVALNGAAAGIATSASFSFAAQFPPLYIQAFFSGQGVCGIAITCVAFLLKAVLNDKKRNEERVMWLVFYQVSAVVVLVAVFAYFVLLKLPITLYYTKQRVEVAVKLHHYGTVHSFHSVEAITDSLQKEEKKSILKDTKHVVREILPLGFGVAFVFSVTLAVFPGLSGSIPSEMGLGNWYSLILLALFMIGDVVGRIFAKWFVLFSERTVLFPILARVVFIWFFLMPHTTSWKIPDPIVMIVMLLMAISNGYLASLAMMFGPSKVDHEFRKLAGGAMYVFLVSGLLAGTGMAFAFRGMGL
eukprot:c11424_g1_i4.p1 GENE.c11424_g1_i4~~c11424_g1_i4.p1  ORF type:complete len:402 (+),score=96.57 c11424_g1_i4:1053-2258(+)